MFLPISRGGNPVLSSIRMHVFFVLAGKLLPLYILLPLGFLAGKQLGARKETLATLLIYIINPVVIFEGVLSADLHGEVLFLPIIMFVLCCILCAMGYFIASFLYKDHTRNILAFASGSGNTGYFGLPVALALFGDAILGTYVMALFGYFLYESTVGFYVTARGHYSIRESVRRALMLPTPYAFLVGLLLNFLGISLSGDLARLALQFRGAYTIIGMMLLGVALADIGLFAFDRTFIAFTFYMKFILWPIAAGAAVLLVRFLQPSIDPSIPAVLLLFSIVPLAVNSVAYATQLRCHPEKMAVAVFLSTIAALVYIPFFISVFFSGSAIAIL